MDGNGRGSGMVRRFLRELFAPLRVVSIEIERPAEVDRRRREIDAALRAAHEAAQDGVWRVEVGAPMPRWLDDAQDAGQVVALPEGIDLASDRWGREGLRIVRTGRVVPIGGVVRRVDL